MATISRRTVFYEVGSGGEFRFHDWAVVNTSLGMMMEPRVVINPIMQDGNSGGTRDAADEITRIDAIQPMSLDRVSTLMSDNPITGGYLFSRSGR